MSEKKPFDAAIGMLRGKGIRLFPPTEVQAAIRVLEAAGKVDKVKALDGMETLRAMMSRELLMNTGPTFQLVHALLEFLPDKEQK
jgi:hypothetical protein